MGKLDIDIVLIDDSVVMNGFRALMTGAKLDAFKKNPVMLFMHNRAQSSFISAADNDTMLPIGKWCDIRIEGNQVLAKPDFDDDDPFAQKIQKKVAKGYLNGASIWIDPVAVSDDDSLALAGQRGPTITEWGILEASIVDIPNCRNALAIRNSAGKRITLNGNAGDEDEVISYLKTLLPTDKNTHMDKKLLCAKLGLPESATDEQISEKLSALNTTSIDVVKLTSENKQLKDRVVELNLAAEQKKITELVDGGITDKKLQAGDREKYMKLAAADFATTKELIDSMKAYESIESKLSVSGAASDTDKLELEGLLKLSGNVLYMDGKLERLQALSPEHFKLKYKEAFGVEFKG